MPYSEAMEKYGSDKPDLRFGMEFVELSSIVTVSYTHLRAHETVLDIVCRLLLEKKIIHPQFNNTLFPIPQTTLTIPT